MINMEVNGVNLQIELCHNSSAAAIKSLLRQGPLTLDMMDYAHMEKFGRLKTSLPANDRYITVRAGDVILSEGNLLVIYYAPNTWNFTRLGRVKNLSETELRKVLGKGNITAVFRIGSDQNAHERKKRRQQL